MRIRREAASTCAVSLAAEGKMVDPYSASARWTASPSPSPTLLATASRSCVLRPCERVEFLRVPGIAPSAYVVALVTDAGLRVSSSAAVGVSGKGLLFPFPSLRDGGRCSFSVYDACWRSRRWFMRQIHALEPFVEEDGGSTLVWALVAGDRKLRAVARSWGAVM